MLEKIIKVNRKLFLMRFKNINELKDKVNDLLKEYNFKVKDIYEKSYYENDFQDYEIMFDIYDMFDNLLYDFTIYYCKTRINENIIVETSYEQQF